MPLHTAGYGKTFPILLFGRNKGGKYQNVVKRQYFVLSSKERFNVNFSHTKKAGTLSNLCSLLGYPLL